MLRIIIAYIKREQKNFRWRKGKHSFYEAMKSILKKKCFLEHMFLQLLYTTLSIDIIYYVSWIDSEIL